MKRTRAFRCAILFLSLAALLAWSPGCGGGGGNPSAVPTRVALFLTDGPTDDFSHVYLTVTSASLLGGGGAVTLFSGSRTFDLLQLTSQAALLTLVEGLPEGSYDKLRMEVSKVEILDRSGNSVGDVKLPSGKIDLNPQGPFAVVAGEPLLIMLDIDAEKSIHVVKRGGKDEYNFRPVVFVKVADAVAFDRLVRASGFASQVDSTTRSFFLAEGEASVVRLTHHDGDDDGEDDGDSGNEAENDHEGIRILTASTTSFFGPLGAPSTFAGIASGGFVTVAGFPVTSGHDLDDEPMGISAVVAEMGTGWTTVGGTVMSAPAPSGAFLFVPDDAGRFGTPVTVLLQPGTRIFGALGKETTAADLLPGARARIDAVVFGDKTAGFTLPAALVVLRTPVTGAVGTISAIDGSAMAFSLSPPGGATVEVQATSGTIVLLLGISPDGLALRQVPFSALTVGQTAAVSGYPTPGGALQAACIAAWSVTEFPGP